GRRPVAATDDRAQEVLAAQVEHAAVFVERASEGNDLVEGEHRGPARRYCRRSTRSAIAAEAGSAAARRPAVTPSRSAALRFWLTFHLPDRRAIGSSKPTMPFIRPAT